MTTYQSNINYAIHHAQIAKPAEVAEERLVRAILENVYPVNSTLPGERDLASQLGVTRPTLRETLQRLERDGWVEISQGKPTRVRDYLKEGSLGVLKTIARYPDHFPQNFIPDLLTVRLAMAPTYTALAVEKFPNEVVRFFQDHHTLQNEPNTYAVFDWQLHHSLTILSDNPVFVMILNGFKELYLQLAPFYFSILSARQHSYHFYQSLQQAAENQNPNQARILTDIVMQESIIFWKQINLP